MKDQFKTKQVLIQELASLRKRIEELEQSESEWMEEKEGLKKSEARFRSYFNLPMHGIAIISPEKGWIEVNDHICSMIGYSRDEILRMTWSEMTHPDDLAANLKQFNHVLSGQIDHYNMDKRFIRKDGQIVWTNLSVGSVRKPDGSVDHMIAVVEDITERKQIEAALRTSEERFHKIFQASPAPTYISSISDGRYIDVNNSGLQLLGYTGEEIIGHTVRELGIWHNSSERKLIVQKLIARDSIRNEPVLLRTKNGETKETLLSCEIIRLNDEEVMLSLVYDITERRQAEEVLRKRDILFKKLSSWVPGMIYQFMMRPDGTYCMPFTTEAIKDIFGCSPQDVRDDFSPIARAILPEDFDKVISSIEDSAKHLTVWTCECRVQIPGQSIRWILGNSTPEKLADGSITWHGFITDITERKQMEEALKQSESKLSSIIEFLPDATAVVDLEGKIIAWNRAMEKMTGVSKENMLGQGDHAYTIPFYGERRQHLVDLLDVSDQDIESQYQYVQKNGNILYAETFAPALYGGKGAYIFATTAPLFNNRNQRIGAVESIRDVTDFRQAVEMLRKSEDKYRTLIETTDTGFVIIDRDGIVQDANREYVRLSGHHDLHEIVGRSIIEWTPGYEKEKNAASVKACFEKGYIRNLEIDHIDAKGNVIPVEINATCLEIEGKTLSITICRDITERKRAEEALKSKTKDLEEANIALKVLLAQLEKGRNDLEERILSNIRELILPYVNNLRHGKLSVHQVSLVDTIESNLNRISSSFLQHLKLNFYNLTPREIEIANLVKEGRSIKEIAELLSVTKKTIEAHRSSLRNKLGIKNKKSNLRSHLLNIQ
ncbi:MAG TPA: PAS domain S-box protein [Smithella sp.]|nr:PAS domain S-box protein [Smithella sp.]